MVGPRARLFVGTDSWSSQQRHFVSKYIVSKFLLEVGVSVSQSLAAWIVFKEFWIITSRILVCTRLPGSFEVRAKGAFICSYNFIYIERNYATLLVKQLSLPVGVCQVTFIPFLVPPWGATTLASRGGFKALWWKSIKEMIRKEWLVAPQRQNSKQKERIIVLRSIIYLSFVFVNIVPGTPIIPR